MRRLKNKSVKVLLLSTVLLSMASIPGDYTVSVNEQFDAPLVQKVKLAIQDDSSAGTQLLEVNSPGGRVDSYEEILKLLEDYNVDSLSKGLVASAAAELAFTVNGTIYAEEGSQILFHGASMHVNGVDITEPYLKAILDSGVLPIELMGLLPPDTATALEMLRNTYLQLKALNDKLLLVVQERHPGVDPTVLRETVYGNMAKDTFFTPQQLQEFGFDLVIGTPDMSKYKSVPVLSIVTKFLGQFLTPIRNLTQWLR